MARITKKHVDYSARRLNEILGLPIEPYLQDKTSDRYVAQIGCIHVCSQNNSHNIYQLANEAGGCHGLAYGLSLRECDNWLNAAMVGIRLERQGKEA